MSNEKKATEGGDLREATRKTRITGIKPTARVKPYTKREELPQFDKLTLLNELCQRRGCECTKKRKAENSEAKLNYARACAKDGQYPADIIADAKLRLHNNHKDHREVLRAARLKIHKHSQAQAWNPQHKLSPPSQNKELFKDSKLKDMPNFSSIAASSAKKTKTEKPSNSANNENNEKSVDKNKYSGATFSALRSKPASSNPAVSGDTLDLQDLQSTLPTASVERSSPQQACPLHRGRSERCTCTCAQQARLHPDDLTVEELACYLEEFVYIPRKMSSMAEMMYTWYRTGQYNVVPV